MAGSVRDKQMWETATTFLDAGTTLVSITQNSRRLSYSQVLDLWSGNDLFVEYFSETLLKSPFPAAFWETPPVTSSTLDQPFEFVLVKGSMLENLKPEAHVFAEHFSSGKFTDIASFPNLGGDAVLIVPLPLAPGSTYTHLLRFLRDAPKSQVRAFWRTAGDAMHGRISNRPIWLSTAGLGVSWLHLRLDSRPKYYRHTPFKCGQDDTRRG